MKKIAIFAVATIFLLIMGWGFLPPLGRPARIIDTNANARVGQPRWSFLTAQDLQTKINHFLFGPKLGLAVGSGRVYFGAGTTGCTALLSRAICSGMSRRLGPLTLRRRLPMMERFMPRTGAGWCTQYALMAQ